MTDYLTKTDNFMASLGVEVYRVGGSVRDEILGHRVKDADYMVRGVSLNDLFDVLQAQGREYSVSPLKLRDGRVAGARVHRKGLGLVEIALPRKEVSTGPGHRDFKIVLDPDLPIHEDAKRRDFTFNALYKRLNAEGSVVSDPTACGLYDIQHRLVRTTHPDSFRDDPLRILRALRFVSVLGYDLAQNTLGEMREHFDAVNGLNADGNVSGTVLDELCKLLMGPDVAKSLRIARDTGVLGVLLPELAPMLHFDQQSRYHDLTTGEHTFVALETAAKVDAPLRVRMALLFHDAGKPASAWRDAHSKLHYYATKTSGTEDHEVVGERIWRSAAERLNAPRDLREDVAKLIANHMVTVMPRSKATKVARARIKLGDDLLRDLYLHRCCDLSGKGVKVAQNHIAAVAALEAKRADMEARRVPCKLTDLAINGKDAMAAGIDGPAIGRVLRAVLDEVAVEPNKKKLTREWQLARMEALA